MCTHACTCAYQVIIQPVIFFFDGGCCGFTRFREPTTSYTEATFHLTFRVLVFQVRAGARAGARGRLGDR